MFSYFIVFILGLIVGALFSAPLFKWFNKAKSAGKEIAGDFKSELDKHKSKSHSQ